MPDHRFDLERIDERSMELVAMGTYVGRCSLRTDDFTNISVNDRPRIDRCCVDVTAEIILTRLVHSAGVESAPSAGLQANRVAVEDVAADLGSAADNIDTNFSTGDQ